MGEVDDSWYQIHRSERSRLQGGGAKDFFSGARFFEAKIGPSTTRLRRFAQDDVFLWGSDSRSRLNLTVVRLFRRLALDGLLSLILSGFLSLGRHF